MKHPMKHPISNGIRILIIGEERDGDLMPTWRRALQDMGHQVQTFDQGIITMRAAQSLFWKAVHKLTLAPLAYRVSWNLRAFIRSLPPKSVDLALVCSGTYLTPDVLRELKEQTGCLLFNWQTGDYSSPTLSSRFALEGIPLYDCVFSHGAFDVPFSIQAGVRRAEYLPLGCNPDLYHPISEFNGREPEVDVVFVGQWRPEREALLEELVRVDFPHSMEIWGTTWRNGRPAKTSPLYKYVRFRATTWDDMGPTIRRGKIALALLTRFDTGRVVAPLRLFEIPAAGVFMLAGRGKGESLEFFKEGEEMACFSDVKELREKIRYYLTHDKERHAIQAAGQRRVLESGYLAPNRLERIIQVYNELQMR